jgi:prolyl-tRNA synthetase
MSTIFDYVGRTNDLCIFDNVNLGGSEIRLDLINSMCTGVQKLAQKIISLLLTAKGSVIGDPNRGTDFLSDLYSGRLQTATDVGVSFGAAVLDITNQINVVATDSTPNDEIIESPEAFEGLSVKKEDFKPQKSIEVGNIFSLGTRFSDAFELTFLNTEGKPEPVIMGSYGIGPGRLMGAIVEVLSDEKGIVWPESVAPFAVHLIEIAGKERGGEEKSQASVAAENLYKKLTAAGVEVLFDDRDARPGEKFADADLIGIPYRVVVSEKTLAAGGVELKKRTEDATEIVTEEELLAKIRPEIKSQP